MLRFLEGIYAMKIDENYQACVWMQDRDVDSYFGSCKLAVICLKGSQVGLRNSENMSIWK